MWQVGREGADALPGVAARAQPRLDAPVQRIADRAAFAGLIAPAVDQRFVVAVPVVGATCTVPGSDGVLAVQAGAVGIGMNNLFERLLEQVAQRLRAVVGL